jgi:hypothetical protein
MGFILHFLADAVSETRPDAAAIIHGAADAYAAAPPDRSAPSRPAASASLDRGRAQALRARGANMHWNEVIAFTLTQVTQALNQLQSTTEA